MDNPSILITRDDVAFICILTNSLKLTNLRHMTDSSKKSDN